jgi:hypothetical protein
MIISDDGELRSSIYKARQREPREAKNAGFMHDTKQHQV